MLAQFSLYVHASVEQLESVALCRGRSLRHLHVLKVLQEHKLCDHRDVHNWRTMRTATCTVALRIPLSEAQQECPTRVEERKQNELEELLELSLHGHRNVAARPVFVSALGWRYSSSPWRKRREVKRRDARVPVPVPDQSLLIPFADPHHLDARRWLPGRRSSASVPVARLARVVIPEPHPLNGVQPAWMGSTRGAVPTPSAKQPSHFF